MSPIKSARQELSDRLRELANRAPRLKTLSPELVRAAIARLSAEEIVATLSDAEVTRALERLRTN